MKGRCGEPLSSTSSREAAYRRIEEYNYSYTTIIIRSHDIWWNLTTYSPADIFFFQPQGEYKRGEVANEFCRPCLFFFCNERTPLWKKIQFSAASHYVVSLTYFRPQNVLTSFNRENVSSFLFISSFGRLGGLINLFVWK